MNVLLAYSGGLDTSWLAAWLSRNEGHSVTALSVDCGGWSEDERVAIAARAVDLGAVEHRFVDARAELFDRVLRWLVAGNVRRGGVYPLSVGAERGLQAEILARVALEGGFDAVCHGCTAAGNDQVRFEAALSTIAPDLTVLAPVRDLAPSRTDQCAYLAELGHPQTASAGSYSVNAGLWGLTIGGAEMLDSTDPLPGEAWCWTKDGAGQAVYTIGFEHGAPVSLNGEALGSVALIERLNLAAGALGFGRGYHLGDTVLGFKGRIAFEAPAAELILTAHAELEKLVLTEDQRFWKDHLGDVYGRRLHQGLFHDPFQRDLEAFFASSQARVTGEVRIEVNGGAAQVLGSSSRFSLMAASSAQYGERAADDSAGASALGLARVFAEPSRLFRRAGAEVKA